MNAGDELLSHATEFTFYPTPDPNLEPLQERYNFELKVALRGEDRWAVTSRLGCMRKDGHVSYEPLPSSRTDRFKKAYRFSRDEAVAIARKYVDKQTINGATYAQWQRHHSATPHT